MPVRFVIVLACAAAVATAAHGPLLPRPQKVEYGSGQVPVAGLRIRISGAVAAEDRFAASELTRVLSERTGIALPLTEGSAAQTPEIVLERTGPLAPLPEPGEAVGAASREAYTIEVGASGAVVRARTSAGVFYGVQTLRQLVEGNGSGAFLPEARIEDWPSLALRGTMVDMSEGQLATEGEVRRQIEELARWKANQYCFYNEDSIRLDGYPLLNPTARFTKDQVRGLIAYGRERHIDVMPCLELYGHQHDLFRIEKYSGLADFPHGGEFDPNNPKIRALLNDWVDQYSELFPSPYVHIGFDETWEIAQAAKKQGAGVTPARLFVKQLTLVARRFQERGKVVMAWGDIMVKYPEIIAELPPGLIAVPWWYEPEPDPAYKKWVAPLASRHVPFVVAPGVNMFTEISPDFAKSFRNIDTFVAAGKKAGALGLLNTFWTDNQQVLRRMAWSGYAYGAAAAWQTSPMDPATFFSEWAAVSYPAAAAPHVAAALEKLSAAEVLLQKIWGVHTMDSLWQSPFAPRQLALLEKHRDDLREARLAAEEAQEHLAAALDAGGGASTLDSLVFASRLLDYAGMRGIYAVEIAGLWKRQGLQHGGDEELWDLISSGFSRTHGRVGDLFDEISQLKPLYRESWLAEYTPYRLENAMARWDRENLYWQRVQDRYERFHERYSKGQPLPALEVLTGEY